MVPAEPCLGSCRLTLAKVVRFVELLFKTDGSCGTMFGSLPIPKSAKLGPFKNGVLGGPQLGSPLYSGLPNAWASPKAIFLVRDSGNYFKCECIGMCKCLGDVHGLV